jgi:RNA polymerase sigma factor (sigma-70 family)
MIQDRPPLTGEQQRLVNEHWSAVKNFARKYAGRVPYAAAEMESAAGEILCLAAQDFEPARGLKFWTYLSPRLVGGFKDALRGCGPLGYRRSSSPPLVFSAEAYGDAVRLRSPDGVSMHCGFAADEESVDEQCRYADLVRSLASEVYGDAREVFTLYHLHGLKLKAIGESMGVSESRASQLLTMAHQCVYQTDLERKGVA